MLNDSLAASKNLTQNQSQTAPEELISYYDYCFEILCVTKTSSSDLNIHNIFTYSDKSRNTVSLVCLVLSKVLYWGDLLSLVQELLCQE